MLENLRKRVTEANNLLVELGLVDPITTFGNVSSIDEKTKYVAIKPSGLSYKIKKEDVVVVDLEGNIVYGNKKPSSDTLTHLELYKNFPEINSIIHTHSLYATAFAQAKTMIKCLGTTHADYFNGDIPIIKSLSKDKILSDYESNTGKSIVAYFKDHNIDPLEISACLVCSHGPFIWGESLKSSLEKAVILEEIAKMNYTTININRKTSHLKSSLRNKHYLRKHGPNAYYGQVK